MKKSDEFISVSELAKKLHCEEKKLIRMACQGLLKIWVIAPDTYEQQYADESVELPIDYTFEYHVMDSILLQDMIGRGKEYIDNGSVIQIKNQLKTYRRTTFGDLLILEEEGRRLESELTAEVTPLDRELNKSPKNSLSILLDPTACIVAFKGEKHALTPPQFACLKVLYQRYIDFKEGKVQSSSMPQKEITKAAKLPENVTRLNQVFKSRQDSFYALIKSYGRGSYSLNLDEK